MSAHRPGKSRRVVLLLALLWASSHLDAGAVRADDVNGDGTSDLVWVDVDGHVSIWVVSGGDVVDSALYSVGPDYRFVGSGDIDSDGDDDLVWQRSDEVGNAIAVWFMDGARVTSTWGRDVVGDSWRALAVGPVDGAGGADIVFATQLLSNDMGPNPILTAYRLATWYLDGSGLVGSDIGIFPNPQAQQGIIWWHSAGDFDGDGTTELLLGPRQGPSPDIPQFVLDMRWPDAPDVRPFPWLSNPFAYGWPGDFTGDGITDVYLHTRDQIATIQVRATDGTPSYVDLPPLARELVLIGVADLDGSGQSDLIWSYNGYIAVWLNVGGGVPSTWDLGPLPDAAWQLESSTMIMAHG